jgi:hypothetical protein
MGSEQSGYLISSMRRYELQKDGTRRRAPAPSTTGLRNDPKAFMHKFALLNGVVYKYVAPDRFDVLLNNLIRFTPPSVSNDLTDCLPRLIQAERVGQNLARAYYQREIRELPCGWLPRSHSARYAKVRGAQFSARRHPRARRDDDDVSATNTSERLRRAVKPPSNTMRSCSRGQAEVKLKSGT